MIEAKKRNAYRGAEKKGGTSFLVAPRGVVGGDAGGCGLVGGERTGDWKERGEKLLEKIQAEKKAQRETGKDVIVVICLVDDLSGRGKKIAAWYN